MKLFYLPGSCALGPHIALEYSRLPYEAVRIERGSQTDPSSSGERRLAAARAFIESSSLMID
jgi:hypothetical protein